MGVKGGPRLSQNSTSRVPITHIRPHPRPPPTLPPTAHRPGPLPRPTPMLSSSHAHALTHTHARGSRHLRHSGTIPTPLPQTWLYQIFSPPTPKIRNTLQHIQHSCIYTYTIPLAPLRLHQHHTHITPAFHHAYTLLYLHPHYNCMTPTLKPSSHLHYICI